MAKLYPFLLKLGNLPSLKKKRKLLMRLALSAPTNYPNHSVDFANASLFKEGSD